MITKDYRILVSDLSPQWKIFYGGKGRGGYENLCEYIYLSDIELLILPLKCPK